MLLKNKDFLASFLFLFVLVLHSISALLFQIYDFNYFIVILFFIVGVLGFGLMIANRSFSFFFLSVSTILLYYLTQFGLVVLNLSNKIEYYELVILCLSFFGAYLAFSFKIHRNLVFFGLLVILVLVLFFGGFNILSENHPVYIGRLSLLRYNPISLSQCAAMLLVLSLILSYDSDTAFQNILYFFAISVCLLVLYYCGSRLSAVAAFLGFLFVIYKYRFLSFKIKSFVFLIVFLSVIIFSGLLPKLFHYNSSSINEDRYSLDYFVDGHFSLLYRFQYLYDESVQYRIDALTTYFGESSLNNINTDTKHLSEHPDIKHLAQYPHNLLLSAHAHGGWLLFSLVFILVVNFIYLCFKINVNDKNIFILAFIPFVFVDIFTSQIWSSYVFFFMLSFSVVLTFNKIRGY